MKGKNSLNYVEVESDQEQEIQQNATKANHLQMLSSGANQISEVTVTLDSIEGQTQRTQQLTDTSNMSSTIDDASIDEPYSVGKSGTNQGDDDATVQGIRKSLPNLKLHIPLSVEQREVLQLFHQVSNTQYF